MWDFTANTNDWVMEQVLRYFGPERFIYGTDFPIFRMKSRRTVENGVYINEIPQGQFPAEAIRGDSHMREIPYPEAEKILPAHSNIRGFMADYDIIRSKVDEEGDYHNMWRLFDMDFTGDFNDYPEDSSLRRAYKKFLLDGNRTGSGYGVFFY